MSLTRTDRIARLRALFVLGRVSNLPTVWSNCLAGWLLGDGGNLEKFPLLCLGATFLYVGGMFLNDAFDVQFDRQHRAERPIPSGAIEVGEVWAWGFGSLGLGLLCSFFLGKTAVLLAVLLAVLIVVYDAIHKIITFSPVLMAGCRFLLYLLAASVADAGVTGIAIWSALALAAYVVGLSYLARKESTQTALRHWPSCLLTVPLLLALVVNGRDYLMGALLLSAILAAWILWCLRFAFWSADRNVGRTVSGLLAGIVLVDLLAVGGEPLHVFLLLFGAALLFQRFVPAT